MLNLRHHIVILYWTYFISNWHTWSNLFFII